MTSSSTADERVFAEIKRLCYAGLDAPTLHRRVLGCLERAVPFDGSCAHDADPASGLMIRMYLDPPDARAERFFLEHIYFNETIDDVDWMLRARQPVARLSETTGGQLERSLRYRLAIAPRGFHFDLRGVFASGREHWGGLTILRERGARDFSVREVTLVARVGSHLAAGLKLAALSAQAPLAAADAGPGVLILDQRGRVVQHTPSAAYWLGEIGELGPGWQDGQGLPGAIWLAVGALRRALCPTTERERASVPRILTQGRGGRWLHVHAALAEATDGETGNTVLVIEPAGPRELVWLRATAFGLSAREREVVELVVRGATTRHIADALSIAEYTVQDHLSHIFDKVGVRGRRALVKRLYLDSLYPAPGIAAERGGF
jgi:DNA-binding CsgD family transcriptional regulator